MKRPGTVWIIAGISLLAASLAAGVVLLLPARESGYPPPEDPYNVLADYWPGGSDDAESMAARSRMREIVDHFTPRIRGEKPGEQQAKYARIARAEIKEAALLMIYGDPPPPNVFDPHAFVNPCSMLGADALPWKNWPGFCTPALGTGSAPVVPVQHKGLVTVSEGAQS